MPHPSDERRAVAARLASIFAEAGGIMRFETMGERYRVSDDDRSVVIEALCTFAHAKPEKGETDADAPASR